ncbi:glutamate receptor 2.7 [Vitis vinifera]|uniref:glutamate receptor 2.7 n=1 Tax=Vitis vinifera TaxID=29760 RepID=UPI00053FDE34|nr:glutamate receptor 2.7 [Vitis vinifera]|eukprot:XP_010644368.1 PREDICTED: glutamate receptor 2.7-like [Vitis vinifera]
MGYLQMSRFFFSFMTWVQAAADHGGISYSNDSIGVIVDYGSRVGKEEKVAMELAIDDFYNKTNQRLVLRLRDSQGDPLRRRLSANHGPHREAASAGHCRPSDLGGGAPFLVQASPIRYWQMNAVAAIVGSWRWRWITVIYEDIDSAATDIIPCLADALKQVGSEIGYLLALPPFTVNSSTPLSDELERLKGRQSRVFVLHSSLSMAHHESCTFCEFCNHLSSMQGILGLKSYFSQSGPWFQEFDLRFREKFHSLYPKEDNQEPGIFALQAYDAVWCVALAMEAASSSKKGELGFWFKGFGFSKTTNETAKYGRQLRFLGQVLWPGYPWSVPRGWSLPTSQKPLRIGVPQRGTFQQFVNVTYDGSHYSVTGLSIEVFNATLEHPGYPLTYKLIPYNGSYDSLVEQVHLKKCLEVEADDDHSISPDSLWALFLATGATSTVSLAIYVARHARSSISRILCWNTGIWRLTSAAMRSWIHHHAQRTRSSAGDIKRTSSLVELGTYRGSHGNA